MTSSPILNNSIKTIACESLQSGVGRVIVASLQSCSCPVGHLLSCWVRRIFQAETDQSCFCIFFYSSPVAGWWTRRQGRDIPLSLGSPCSSRRTQAPGSWKVKRETICILVTLRKETQQSRTLLSFKPTKPTNVIMSNTTSDSIILLQNKVPRTYNIFCKKKLFHSTGDIITL